MITRDGIKILDKYLKNRTLAEIFNIGERSQEEVSRRIVLWAKENDAKIVSVMRIAETRDISGLNLDGIISIEFGKGINMKIGILKVYGNVDFEELPQFMKY